MCLLQAREVRTYTHSRRVLGIGDPLDRFISKSIEDGAAVEEFVFQQKRTPGKPLWDSGVRDALHQAAEIEGCDSSGLGPNPRTHSDAQVAQIAASIREFGFTNPILVDSLSGIIAGHGRLLAARKLKLEQVPVIILDHLSETQKRAYIIADNKLAENAAGMSKNYRSNSPRCSRMASTWISSGSMTRSSRDYLRSKKRPKV